jgi:hypothetical protein
MHLSCNARLLLEHYSDNSCLFSFAGVLVTENLDKAVSMKLCVTTNNKKGGSFLGE